MKIASSSFRSYITGSGKALIFTSLFYSFWLIISQVLDANFDLNSFSGRKIGLATLEGVGVEERIALFYKCLLLFFVSFSLFILAGYLIFKKLPNLLSCPEVKTINYTSLAGIFIFLFKVFETEVYETLEIIYFLQKLMLAFIILRNVISKNSRVSIYQLSIILSLAIAGYFFIADLNNLAGYSKNPDFYFTTFIIACLLLVALIIFLRKSANKQDRLRIIAFTLLPLLLLPFVSILKDEIFLVVKANGLVLSNQLLIYLILVILLISAIVFRYKKRRGKEVGSDKKQLARGYFPLLIFSLTAYVSYSYYTEYYDEIFESGNVYLPIMEHKFFGTISPIEKLNTHLLSDYFFASIYTFFNGLKINEITLYDFFLAPISYTLYYYLLRFLTRNEFVALFCVLLFPYAEAIMPEGFCLAIIGIFALIKIIKQKQSVKKYAIYFVTIILLLLWRIDLGYNCLLTMPFVLLYFNFRDDKYKINWQALLKALGIVAGSAIVLIAILSAYRQVNLFSKVSYFINYCASAQSYSYGVIGDPKLPSYKMHYIIFPAFVALIIVLLTIKHKQLVRTNSQRVAYLSLLFICIFYFVNFNRGLIRHCLFEGSDVFTSSFIYLIFGGSVFVFLRKENYLVKCIIFFVSSFIVINAYKVPEVKGLTGLFEKIERKIKTTQNINLANIKSRIKNAPNTTEGRHKEFSDFIKKQTKTSETFIDFSNRPMLYFFSEKVTPSWFYQNPLCIQNDFLQKKFIEDLAEYKTPYLLFSGITYAGYDVIDDVPNNIRHYKMAEYFYNNFKPYVIVENLCVWKRNDQKDNNKKDTLFKYISGVDSFDFEKKIELKINSEKKQLVKITSTLNQAKELSILLNNKVLSAEKIYSEGNTSYYLINVKAKQCSLIVKNENSNIEEVVVVECDYLPDYFSEKFVSYDLKKLPYVWATYDELCKDEKVLFENNKVNTVENKGQYKITIPEMLDRSSGNTLVIICKANNKAQKLNILFGNKKESNRTRVAFDIISSDKEEKYAVRISSIYKWYSGNVNELYLVPEEGKSLIVSKIIVTKGN